MAYRHVNHILGSKGRQIKTQWDLLALSERGVTKQALLRLSQTLSLSKKEIASVLQVSERTLQRYGERQVLGAVISGRVVHLAELVQTGLDIYGDDREGFVAWLRSPSIALGGRAPMQLLNSSIGTQMVIDELIRMAHGVYS